MFISKIKGVDKGEPDFWANILKWGCDHAKVRMVVQTLTVFTPPLLKSYLATPLKIYQLDDGGPKALVIGDLAKLCHNFLALGLKLTLTLIVALVCHAR